MSAAQDREVEAARWLRYAREDLAAAKSPEDETTLAARHRCMLAQQAAEKALKAALILLDIDPPRTHNLQLLVDLLPKDWSVSSVSVDFARLSVWIVESRYPGDWPEATSADADTAVAGAASIVEAVASKIERSSAE